MLSARIVLVRHGQSTWNAEGRLQGQADPPLSKLGRREAVALRGLLPGFPAERVLTSDLRRTRETAAALGHPEAAPDPVWREIDVGEWAGRLLADLPAGPATPAPRPAGPANGPEPGRHVIAYKNSVRHAGRWRVPGSFRALIYKGSGVFDLRAAELTAAVTDFLAVAYKSNIQIVVPPGVRVEVSGFGATRDDEWAGDLPADAPVVHVRAFAYKGIVEARTTPKG